jgi:hypothetical protein
MKSLKKPLVLYFLRTASYNNENSLKEPMRFDQRVLSRLLCHNGWDGNFPLNTPVLYDNGVPGAVTIDFATPITNITDLALESNEFGAFTATLQAYDGLTYLGSQSFMSTSADDPGSQMSFNFSSAAITSIVLSSTNDGAGLGLGGAGGTGGYSGGVPEPTAWALMLLGVAGLGATLRRRREQGAFA